MRVFIVCPANMDSGGPELLHQFAKCLSDNGIENYMLYVDREMVTCPTPDVYLKYEAKYVSKYIDAKDSVLVLPETQIHRIDWCQNGLAMIWWLSVNNYAARYKGLDPVSDMDYFHLKERRNVVHFVQSYYAKDFLEKKLGIEKVHFLMDYINEDIVDFASKYADHSERKNKCLYNPSKGYETLKPVMEACRKDILWIPLTGLKPLEMAKLMCTAKLYVDFGSHPGKDRIPREAAICGCCVLTNKQGSAGYRKDVGIPEDYKISDCGDIPTVLEKIYELIDHYEEKKSCYSEYRMTIQSEKAIFLQDAREAIKVLQSRTQTEEKSINRHQKDVYQSVENAVCKARELCLDSCRLSEKGNVSGAIDKLLVMDYVLQLVQETIYIQMQEMVRSEDEDENITT